MNPEVKEQDIRPEVLLQRYLELSAEDARECFGAEPRSAVACVACGGSNGSCQFDKNGFAYVRCADCGTLFQCEAATRLPRAKGRRARCDA